MIDFKRHSIATAFAKAIPFATLGNPSKSCTKVYVKCPIQPLHVCCKDRGLELCFRESPAIRQWRRDVLITRRTFKDDRYYVFFKASWNVEELKIVVGDDSAVVKEIKTGHARRYYDMD